MKTTTNHERVIHIAFITAICALLFLSVFSYGQNVGINNPTPNASALLDLTSTTKGLLVPRMTMAQRTAISTPANGLLVYDSTLNEFWYFDGTAWKKILGESRGWTTLGNTGTVDGVNFIGTTDNVPLNFRINNQKAGRIDQLSGNLFLGMQAGKSMTGGMRNVFIGDSAGYTQYGFNNNTFVGGGAGQRQNSGGYNTFIGGEAGNSSTSCYFNTFIGAASGFKNTTGLNNTYTGTYSGLLGTTASENCFTVQIRGKMLQPGAEIVFTELIRVITQRQDSITAFMD